ncbi:MAG TPA: hypothetical protein VE996_05795 [Terriglobales bacterium]|nr:hypothetical protein [Terriglobales bacterium]
MIYSPDPDAPDKRARARALKARAIATRRVQRSGGARVFLIMLRRFDRSVEPHDALRYPAEMFAPLWGENAPPSCWSQRML